MTERENIEPCACGNPGAKPGGRIEIGRVRERLDALQEAGDEAAAERLLDYWLAEAVQVGDRTGEILVENEYVGFFRKTGKGEAALSHGEKAMALLKRYGLEDTVTAGTTRINLATACTAFGRPERAWTLFTEAREIYEARLEPSDGRLGGLYNNMGLCAQALGRWTEGRALYALALETMEKVPGGEGERAVTCLNCADLVSAEADAEGTEEALERAAEETEELVERAWALLNDPALPRDAYFRFICDKCAPVMAHYGRLEEAEMLRRWAGGNGR